MTLELGLTLVAIGFAGAFVSGLVGVGGAIVMIPLLYYVPPLVGSGRLDIKSVAGVTMVQVLTATTIGAWSYGRRALVHRSLALTGGTAMAVGSLVGAVSSRYVSERLLLAVFGVMATLALPLMLLPPARLGSDLAAASSAPFSRPVAVVCSAVIGLMSGLVGAGGAFLTVPVLIALLRVPVRVAIGTSLAMTGMSAVMGTLGKALTGQIPLYPTGAVIIGAAAGATVGSRMSGQVPEIVLRGILTTAVVLVTLRVWADVLGH